MTNTKDLIIKLRQQTGAGIMAIKEALAEAGGDEAAALDILREKGEKIVAKRADRKAGEGWIGSYVHSNGKVAGLVVLKCETDFVARNSEFQELAHNLAMQVVAAKPLYLRSEAVPAEIIDEEMCLENQLYCKDNSKTIKQLVDEMSAKTGEKIEIGEFARLEV